MAKIHLTTFIAAPADRVFNLSRSISLHKISTANTKEEAIAGTTSGLINLNETVTWRAKHLFKTRQHTSLISAMDTPSFFVDEMTKGEFKKFYHEHHFKQINNGTIMIDIVQFEPPYGAIGNFFTAIYLKKYIEKFLIKRNHTIKEYAESQKWKVILS